jgi:hypothetical protein
MRSLFKGQLSSFWALLLLPALAVPAGAAIQNPDPEDIDYVAEHLPESIANLRYLTLPLAAGPFEPGHWQMTGQAAWGRNSADFLHLGGGLVSLGLTRAWSERWGFQTLGFYDRFTLSGGSGRELLRPLFSRDIPLDLPEFATFSRPRGDVIHFGAGAGLARQSASRKGTWTFGVLWERLDVQDFAVDYRLETGADAGLSGVLDHSATYDFFTPYFGYRRERSLGERWQLVPRVSGALPLPRRGFAGRISGPGFDVAGDTKKADHGVHMGDGYLGVGLGLEHRRSGFGIDLGATLYHFGAERVINKGIDRPLLLSITWHPPH